MDADVDVAQWDAGAAAELPGVGATMRQVFVPAGRVAARHSHPHEQFLRVVSGAAVLECAAGRVELRAGTAIRFAPGAWHSAVFSEDTVLMEFNVKM
jgi:quercetin dioxygenase-like cupin family protein